jgi:hypothetical protein
MRRSWWRCRPQFRDAGIRKNHVELPVLFPDLVVRTIQIAQVGNVAMHCGDVAADLRNRPIQRFLSPAGDEHMIHSRVHESFCRC